jgi:hypothetical protein
MATRKPKVTYRQEDGDDGYSYVVRVNGFARMSGLTRSQAMYEKQVVLREWEDKQKENTPCTSGL